MKKRRHHEEEQGHERWLVSYADFITLMFAFFVILYATSERDVEKTKKFQDSVEKFLVKTGAMGESGANISAGEKNFSVLEQPIPTHRAKAQPDDMKLLETLQSTLEEKLSESERQKYLIDLSPEEKGIRMVLSGRAIYSGDSAKFSSDAVAFINHLGEILKNEKKPLMIEGHVNLGQRGEFSSAWDLASARSVNILRYWQKKYEFSSQVLAASTFGDSRPVSNSKTVAANDRLEVLLYFNDAEF